MAKGKVSRKSEIPQVVGRPAPSFALIFKRLMDTFAKDPSPVFMPFLAYLFFQFITLAACVGGIVVFTAILAGFSVKFGWLYAVPALVLVPLYLAVRNAAKGAIMEVLAREESVKRFFLLVPERFLEYSLIFGLKDLLPAFLVLLGLGGFMFFSSAPYYAYLCLGAGILIALGIKVVTFFLHCPLATGKSYNPKDAILCFKKAPSEVAIAIATTAFVYLMLVVPLLNVLVLLFVLPIIWKARLKLFEALIQWPSQ